MTDDLDLYALLFRNPSGPRPGPARRCRRHDWEYVREYDFSVCRRCNSSRDEATSRRGRTNRSRGNATERRIAAKVGGKRVGQFGGKDDVTNDLFRFQVKSRKGHAFPRWMTDELDALRAPDGREPVLVVVEAFSDRRPARTLFVVDEPTWLALHGTPKEGAA